MDNLKDVLLVFTVVLLVYVLYQRLLQVLGKKERSKRYARVSEQLRLHEGMLAMEITIDQPMSLLISTHAASGNEVLNQQGKELETGTHSLEVNVSTLSAGKYYVQLKTPAETYSRYFELS
jgi:hypothetical protein